MSKYGNRMRSKVRFVKNTLVIILICGVGYYLYSTWFSPKNEGFIMSETPLRIESIMKISELATISFQDEVVTDSTEKFKPGADQFNGNLKKLQELKDMKEAIQFSHIKRKLTLIQKGEVKVGFNLTEENFEIDQNVDTIWIHLPKAEILSLTMNPSETVVFQEHGRWKVYDRKTLLKKAKRRIEKDVKKAKLKTKAEDGMTELLKKIIPGDRTILVYYE